MFVIDIDLLEEYFDLTAELSEIVVDALRKIVENIYKVSEEICVCINTCFQLKTHLVYESLNYHYLKKQRL